MVTDSAPPVSPVTDTDHTAIVVVVSLVSLVYAILAVIAKNFIRLNFTSPKLHDVFLLFATLFLVAQTVCIIFACQAGLGRHQKTLSDDQVQQYIKITYIATLLALLTQVCAKISVSLLISVLANHGYPWSRNRVVHGLNQNRLFRANRILFIIIILWLIAAIINVVVECHVTHMIEEQCLTSGGVYIYTGTMGIITDVALCALPVAMMWRVQTNSDTKLQVTLLFGTRILVPAMSIASVVASAKHKGDPDTTWFAVTSTIWFQVGLNLSVITACMPSLKTFIDSLLGQTAGARIMAPYELEYSEHGISFRRVFTTAGGSNCQSYARGHTPANNPAGIAGRSSCIPENTGSSHGSVGESESTRQLTVGALHRIDRVEVTFESRPASGDL